MTLDSKEKTQFSAKCTKVDRMGISARFRTGGSVSVSLLGPCPFYTLGDNPRGTHEDIERLVMTREVFGPGVCVCVMKARCVRSDTDCIGAV